MAGKLHQLLAVEKDIKNKAQKIITERKETFTQRSKLFNEHRKSYKPIMDDDQMLPTGEFEPMQSTVKDQLDYLEGTIVQTMDILFQKERTNCLAKADIEIDQGDGTKKTLIKDVPVTALVQLENLLEDIRTRVYDAIPTLDPAKVWSPDPNTKNVFIAEPVKSLSIRKSQEPLVLVPPTDKHPAQAQLITVDRPAGNWTTNTRSGCLSSRQKSNLLDRLEKLIAGTKIARAKANDIEVQHAEIGKICFNYINEAFKD